MIVDNTGAPVPLDVLKRAWVHLFLDESLGAYQWDMAMNAHDAEIAAQALEDARDELENRYGLVSGASLGLRAAALRGGE